MSQDQLFYKNSEYDESEDESEYEDIETETECDTEYEDSESDGDYVSQGKRRKLDDTTTEELSTDEKGHIKWQPGQLLNGFEFGAELGEGAFGRVLQVKRVKTGRLVALKVSKNHASKRRAAMAEIIALTIIACRDRFDTSFCMKMNSWFIYEGHVCIEFPLLGTSVFDFLKGNNFEPFNIDEVRHISYQLCSAVTFLHKNGMTHTDLKPENVLFVNSNYSTVYSEQKKTGFRRLHSTDIRLGDFGSVVRDADYHYPGITTRYYRAPEVILGLDWTYSCDIWAIGCILYELYVGNLLFPTHYDCEHLAMIEKLIDDIPTQMIDASHTTFFKNGKVVWDWNAAEKRDMERCQPLRDYRVTQNQADGELILLLKRLLEIDPNRRISASEALTQPYLQKLPSEQQNQVNSYKN